MIPFDVAFYEIIKKITNFFYPVTVEDRIRVIVTHSKTEMEQIKQIFKKKFNQSLESFLHVRRLSQKIVYLIKYNNNNNSKIKASINIS